MGFFDKLLSNFGGGEARPPCPTCGGMLDNEALVEGSYWCGSCGSLFREQGDELVDVKSLRGGELDHCPSCGTVLTGFECWSCKVEFVFEDNKLVERGLSRRGERPDPERRCISCDLPLTNRAELTAAWEDGDNAEAYVTCQSCGYQNAF
jgi:tRNA(Ile2) C34 agmatinyltransferase TiaS